MLWYNIIQWINSWFIDDVRYWDWTGQYSEREDESKLLKLQKKFLTSSHQISILLRTKSWRQSLHFVDISALHMKFGVNILQVWFWSHDSDRHISGFMTISSCREQNKKKSFPPEPWTLWWSFKANSVLKSVQASYATSDSLFIFNGGPAQRDEIADELWFRQESCDENKGSSSSVRGLVYIRGARERVSESPPTLLCNLFQGGKWTGIWQQTKTHQSGAIRWLQDTHSHLLARW